MQRSGKELMQAQNAVSIEYFKNSKRFADLLNGYFFNGDEVVRWENVRERDPVLQKIKRKGTKVTTKVNIVDLFCNVEIDGCRIGVILQNQTKIHYAMPIRAMNEEAEAYYSQWKGLEKEHREKKNLKDGAEFLSGMSRSDSINPLLILIVYFGEEKWDAARSMHKLFGKVAESEKMQLIFTKYPIHVLDIRRFDNADNFHTDLKWVIGFLQKAQNRNKLQKYVTENKEVFENLAEDTYNLLAVMARSPMLEELKDDVKNLKGGWNMCKALDDMVKDGERRGKRLGKNQINKLNRLLLADNRQQELLRSVSDRKLQQKLLQEYAL